MVIAEMTAFSFVEESCFTICFTWDLSPRIPFAMEGSTHHATTLCVPQMQLQIPPIANSFICSSSSSSPSRKRSTFSFTSQHEYKQYSIPGSWNSCRDRTRSWQGSQ